MTRIRKLGTLSLAKLMTLMMALLGFLAGVLYSFGGFIMELVTGTLNTGTALAFLALIGMPLMFASVGFVAGLVLAPLYNFAAQLGFALELDLETD